LHEVLPVSVGEALLPHEVGYVYDAYRVMPLRNVTAQLQRVISEDIP
jgi:hypothetical protein